MTVEQLVTTMSQSEFTHWAMYHQRVAQRRELEQMKSRR